MKHSRTVFGIGCISLLIATNSGAFTQFNTVAESIGHEHLVVAASHKAGGIFKEMSSWPDYAKQYGNKGAPYYTTNDMTWAVVMGNRWTDIGGYNPITQGVCFNAAIQESDGIQYQHALRKKCDVGGDGHGRCRSCGGTDGSSLCRYRQTKVDVLDGVGKRS